MSKLAQLRARRDAKAREAQELNNKYPADQRMPAAEGEKLDAILAEIEAIDGEITRETRLNQIAGDEQAEHEHALNQSTRHGGQSDESSALRAMLAEVPSSKQVSQDLRAWSRDRLMAHYQAIKPWCELILNQQMPIAVSGEWRGMSLLFPMEKLFEKYVEGWLRRFLVPGARLTAQASRHSLCEQGGRDMFRLEPDLLLERDQQAWVLDAKWKRLDGADRLSKYCLSQADFYQLFAYGQKYLAGRGEMALIYPATAQFSKRLEPFDFSPGLRLWVLPFDLDNDELLASEVVDFTRCLSPPAHVWQRPAKQG